MLLKFMDIEPAYERAVTIREPYTYNGNCLRNRIWYRGDSVELEQLYKQIATYDTEISRFWASIPSLKGSVRKIHTGLPAIIVDRLTEIITSDLDEFKTLEEKDEEIFKEIKEDNKINKIIQKAITETLVVGDGAFKITIDNTVSKYPIVEFYSGEDVEYIYKRGRLFEILFYTEYKKGNKFYKLEEAYGKGYIRYKLFDIEGRQVQLNTLEETQDLKEEIHFNRDFMMAVPLKFYNSTKYKNRGKSIFDKKTDCFDALDEVVSQWIDAIRVGRVNKYIPVDLLPVNMETGEPLKPNPFDNNFIKIESNHDEGAKNTIDLVQANINYEAYVNSYLNILDMTLQGIISPSTLGIDLKKTDNAEAQREKEKATIYTRNAIISNLTETLKELGEVILKTNDVLNNSTDKDYEISVSFGEYATPTFDAVIEVMGKARAYGIISLEKAIDELYGNTLTKEEKEEELQRLKEEQQTDILEELPYEDYNEEQQGEEIEEDDKDNNK